MKPAGTQQDRNMNFDGMESIAPKHSNKYQTNQWSGHANDGRTVNKGRGPTRGNQDYRGQGGPSVTKDAFRAAPTSAVPSLPAQGRVSDSIHYGKQERTPGGTRDWSPRAGQNYRGDANRIRIGQQGGVSYGDVARGSKPVAAGKTDGINYGPKSQY